jgi:hypothetical protein
MNNSSYIFTVVGTILITIIVLSLIGVLEPTSNKTQTPTTIVYPERNIYITPPNGGINYNYGNRPLRMVYPQKAMRPVFRRGPRFGFRHGPRIDMRHRRRHIR